MSVRGRSVRFVPFIVTFDTVRVFGKQSTACIYCSHKELKLATITKIEIESVIVCAGRNQILAIYCTTEEFETVILAIISLAVVKGSTCTYSTKGKGIQFIVCMYISTGILYTYILNSSGIVVSIVATIRNINSGRNRCLLNTFDVLCFCLVDRSITQYYETTPTAGSLMS